MTGQQMPRVLALTQIRQHRPGNLSQAENIVQLAVGQEACARGDLAAELNLPRETVRRLI